MENRKRIQKNLLKLIIATAVFYVGLFSFSKKVGEVNNYLEASVNNTPEAKNDHVSEEITTVLEVQTGSIGTDNTHQSAEEKRLALLHKIQQQKKNSYLEKFRKACKKERIYCSILDFNDMEEFEKQYIYLNLTANLGNFIAEYQKFGKPILSTLKKIDLLNKKGSPRAYATWSKITLHEQSIGDYKEYFNLIGHEIGHVLDLGAIHGAAKKKDPLFTEFGKEKFAVDDPSLLYYGISRIDEQTRKEDMNEVNFCSRYGMSNPFEDFAECHNLYLNHNNMFLYIAKRNPVLKDKYNYIANLYGGKYFFDDKENIVKLSVHPDWRVRDTTKMHK